MISGSAYLSDLLLVVRIAHVALQHFQSVQNESYGVLGGGVPQSIELKDNAAYSTVQTRFHDDLAYAILAMLSTSMSI